MNSPNSLDQQTDYLRQRAEQFASLAITRHRRQGRGIIVIGWPAPEFLKLEDLFDSTSYLPEGELVLAGFDTGNELIQVVREYDPAHQAIIMCIEVLKRTFNVHVLTAIYGYAAHTQHDTSH